jgi:ribosomal-protein-alanine N-acetyltransferase
MAELIFRPITVADNATFLRLEKACFGDAAWSATDLSDFLNQPGVLGFLAWQGPGAVGAVIFQFAADSADILTLGVAPAVRRQGVARRLLAHGFAALAACGVTKVFLEVRVSNQAAQQLYRTFGAEEVGRRKGYYDPTPTRPCEDALVFALPLPAV